MQLAIARTDTPAWTDRYVGRTMLYPAVHWGPVMFESPVGALRVLGSPTGYASLQDAHAAIAQLLPATPDATEPSQMRGAIAYVLNADATAVGAILLDDPMVVRSPRTGSWEQLDFMPGIGGVLAIEDGRGGRLRQVGT